MPGVGVRVDVGATATASAAARVQATIQAMVEAQAAAEIWTIAGRLQDQGYLEPDTGPPTCTQCGRERSGSGVCVYCGAEPGEQDPIDQPDPDQEIAHSEDLAASDGDEDETGEVLSRDLPERLRDLLLEQGWTWEEAENAGVWLCGVWESAKPRPDDPLAFGHLVAKSGDAAREDESDLAGRLTVQSDLIATVFDLCREYDEGKIVAPPVGPPTLIRIAMFRGRWRVTVEDPLKGLKRTGKGGRVEFSSKKGSGFSVSLDQWLARHAKHIDRLQQLGEILLAERENFFKAENKAQADAALAAAPLEQQQAAKNIGVSPTSVSRWCREQAGIYVQTPHGLYHLSAFFTAAARTHDPRKLTQAAEFEIVLAMRGDYPNEAHKEWRARLQQECQLNLSERTLRRRLQYAQLWEDYRDWTHGLGKDHIDGARLGEFLKESKQSLPEKDQKAFLRLIGELQELKGGDIWS